MFWHSATCFSHRKNEAGHVADLTAHETRRPLAAPVGVACVAARARPTCVYFSVNPCVNLSVAVASGIADCVSLL